MTIKFWSYSSAKSYDKCPKAVDHRYVLKTPKDEKDNSAAERGTSIHKELENYLVATCTKPERPVQRDLSTERSQTRTPIDPAQFKYEGLIGEVVDLCKKHPFTQEEMLFFDTDWKPVATFNEAWLLAAMDVAIRVSETEIVIVDWKSGKLDGNEVAHTHQSQLYALCASKKWPELTKFTTWFIYVDHGVKKEHVWKAGHMPRFFKQWDEKGKAITSATTFPAKPNKWACRFCDYQQSCDFAIKEGDV